MAIFNRKNNSQDYLSNPDTVSRPVPIISALITGLVVAALVFGIFWAGKWIYDRINAPDKGTTTTQNEQNATGNEQANPGNNQSNNSDSNNGTQSGGGSSSSTGSGSGSSSSGQNQGSQNTGTATSNTPTSSTIPSTGAAPTVIPNTGPDPRYNY